MNYYLLICWFLLVCFSNYNMQAQGFVKTDIIPVFENESEMQMPWIGGLNNPQFSAADLNNDDIDDLVVFDRKDNKLLSFINGGTPNEIDYQYNSSFQKNFPELKHWALLKDYNCDGIEDIFTSEGNYLIVYDGYYNAESELSFTFAHDTMFYNDPYDAMFPVKYLSIVSVDIPAIEDINNDGDIDILTFNLSGGYLEYFENQSQELGYGCDSLIYEISTTCFGEFYESGINQSVSLDSCAVAIDSLVADDGLDERGALHPGSTILAFDDNGDGDKEILVGDITFDNLNYLQNGGDESYAYFVEQDSMFPSYNVPAFMNYFPAAFQLDINNDDVKDIVVAPNGTNKAQNENCSWYYENIGTASNVELSFVDDEFLVGQMIDVGEASRPTFFDFTGDGLLDIIISNDGYFVPGSNEIKSTLTAYRNIGTATDPAFDFANDDFADLYDNYQFVEITPTFGDLDGDGDEDMILGETDGFLHYFRNTAGPNMPAEFELGEAFFQGIDVGQFATPFLFDVSGNGLLDLIIGERNGILNYYENSGTVTNAEFTLVSEFWGAVNVKVDDVVGYSVPTIGYFFSETELSLIVGSITGRMWLYNNIENNLNDGDSFDFVTNNVFSDYEGLRSSVAIADLDGDNNLDAVVGCYRGGLSLYVQDENFTITDIEDKTFDESIQLYPNPANDIVQLNFDKSINQIEYNLISISGGFINNGLITQYNTTIDISQIPNGIYLLQLNSNGSIKHKKLIVQH